MLNYEKEIINSKVRENGVNPAITSESLVEFKNIKDIQSLDLNDVNVYKAAKDDCVVYEFTPIAYMLASSYLRRNVASVIIPDAAKALTLSSYSLNKDNSITLSCSSDDKHLEIDYEDDMKINIVCSKVDLKIIALSVQSDLICEQGISVKARINKLIKEGSK